MTASTTRATPAPPDLVALQRRTLRVLFGVQILGGVAVGIGIAVGALLIEDLTGSSTYAGFAQSIFVGGSALLVIPVVRITNRLGRRAGLAFSYACAVLGALVVLAAIAIANPLLAVAGYFLLGGGSSAGLQARYAGADLAPPEKTGSHLAMIMWALTVGSVTGPSLAAVANRTWIGWFGGADYVGPMVAIGLVSTLTAVLVAVMLRPDPLLTARAVSGETTQVKRSVADGFRIARSNPAVRTGVVSATLGHFVMVGVMAMTALHIRHGIDDLNEALTVVGLILGLHIGGMYALSPVFGRLVDRHGAKRVIGLGIGLLLAACAVAGTSASHAHVQISIGLILLGLGWSAMTVASGALITGAVGPGDRPSAQGFSDMVMGLAAMGAGVASGPIVEWFGYGVLNGIAAVAVAAVLPLLLLRKAS